MSRYGGEALAANLREADHETLAETIEAAGLYNQKAAVLQSVAERIPGEYGDAAGFSEFIATAPNEDARTALMDLDGVGPKTADCVLLFAGGREGVFPVDTHVYRITRRLGVVPSVADHEQVRTILSNPDNLAPSKCGFGHTAMIQFGREYCTARHPVCLSGADACPLFDLCDRRGIDLDGGAVTDPSGV